MRRVAWLVALGAAASGCLTIGAAQPASTMGKGRIQGGVEGSIWAYATTSNNAGNSSGVQWLPSVNGFLRFGVSDHVDLGFRAGGTFLELQSKFMFTDPESRFVFSLAPSLHGYFLPSITDNTGRSTPNTGSLAIPVPLMFGIKLGNHELVFTAREVNQLYFLRDNYPGAPTTQAFAVALGTSAGIALRLGESFILMPELSVQTPIWVSVTNQFGTGSAFGSPLVQFTGGVSCIFGRMKPRTGQPVVEEGPPPPPPPEPYVPPQELPPDVAPPPPPPPPPDYAPPAEG